MRLYVFDDEVADGWAPFSLTRPCGELRFGCLGLRERLELAAGLPAAGLLARPWLRAFAEPDAPPVTSPAELPTSETRLLLSSRFVPEEPLPLAGRDPDATPAAAGRPTLFYAADEPVGCLLPAGLENPDHAWLRRPSPLPGGREVALAGTTLGPVWELVDRGPDRLLADLERAGAPSGGGLAIEAPPPAAELPAGVHALGDRPVLLGPGVRLEPGVVLDVRAGPIRLDRKVEVRAGARLTGPLHAAARCRLLGGALDRLSAGPVSHLRGEIEATVVLGYANKAHDGYLGHAYLGRWVNLGAMTTNSDLKNNYSTVRMGPPGRRIDTGLLKLGCLLGDHVKTGIGLLLATGTVVGAGSNLFGALPPAWVPPFSWGGGEGLDRHRREPFIDTAAVAMGRRGIELGAEGRAWLGGAWDAARDGEGDGAWCAPAAWGGSVARDGS